MTKRNLFKGIVCGLMLTAVVGSAVYAGTGSYEEYGYKDDYIVKTFYGGAGNYRTVAKDNTIVLTATSSAESYKLYKVEVDRKQYYTNQTGEVNAKSAVLKNKGNVDAGLSRDSSDPYDKFVSTGIAYNNASEITGIQDKYTYTIVQNK